MTNVSEMWIRMPWLSLKEMYSHMHSAKYRPLCECIKGVRVCWLGTINTTFVPAEMIWASNGKLHSNRIYVWLWILLVKVNKTIVKPLVMNFVTLILISCYQLIVYWLIFTLCDRRLQIIDTWSSCRDSKCDICIYICIYIYIYMY